MREGREDKHSDMSMIQNIAEDTHNQNQNLLKVGNLAAKNVFDSQPQHENVFDSQAQQFQPAVQVSKMIEATRIGGSENSDRWAIKDHHIYSLSETMEFVRKTYLSRKSPVRSTEQYWMALEELYGVVWAKGKDEVAG